MKACLYLRVSGDDQVEGASLETQEKECRAYCQRNGIEVVRVFTDAGESAKTAARPQFKSLLTYSIDKQNGINCVVAYRLDRLARKTYDYAVFAATLAKYGVVIRSATEPIMDDSTGEFLSTVLAAIAELDNDIRSQQGKDGMCRVTEKVD